MQEALSVVFNDDFLTESIISYISFLYQNDQFEETSSSLFKNITLLTLVSKRFNRLAWLSLVTEEVAVMGSCGVVRLLYRVRNLKKIKAKLRVGKFDEDSNLFQENLLYGGKFFQTCFPSLVELIVEPTFQGLNHEDFVKLKREMIKKERMSSEHIDLLQYELDSKKCEIIIPQTPYQLTKLGPLPRGIELVLRYLAPPTKMTNFEKLSFRQSAFIQDFHLAPLRDSCIKKLTTNPMGVDFTIFSNSFTNKMLDFLPSCIEELSIDSSTNFKIPCKFPSSLKHVKLSAIQFEKPFLAGCFHEGLESLTLCFDYCLEDTSFELGYPFSNFDVTGLPNSLETLVFEDTSENVISIEGVFPSSLKLLTLSVGDFSFDPTLLPPHRSFKLKSSDEWRSILRSEPQEKICYEIIKD